MHNTQFLNDLCYNIYIYIICYIIVFTLHDSSNRLWLSNTTRPLFMQRVSTSEDNPLVINTENQEESILHTINSGPWTDRLKWPAGTLGSVTGRWSEEAAGSNTLKLTLTCSTCPGWHVHSHDLSEPPPWHQTFSFIHLLKINGSAGDKAETLIVSLGTYQPMSDGSWLACVAYGMCVV